ncbi:amidohydrolase family protein [Nonomuraea sp. NPDC050691]|uniref:amidohydrolase family protein n=1 Tax=Nonomuraea sp. NPDC050691 TaxID=3155661 RepID=UPI0033C15B30
MRTLIRATRVFDGEHSLPRADVLIDGDRIAAVTPAAEPAPGADVVIDGSGRTLLPGLIDAHTHTFDGSLAQALAFGVTTELDMFCLPGNLARQRRAAAERDDVADLRSCGVLATAPGGHPSQIMAAEGAGLAGFGDAIGPFPTLSGPDEAKAFVEARLAEGADYLKIVIDEGHAAGLELPTLSPETVAALVEGAHAAGLLAIAHVATAAHTAVALDAGVDGLAHVHCDLPPDDPRGEKTAARIAAHDVFVATTLTYIEAVTGDESGAELLGDPRVAARLSPAGAGRGAGAGLGQGKAGAGLVRSDPGAVPVHSQGVINAAHAVRLLHGAGVTLLAGTDANPFAPLHGASLHRELLMLTEAGLTPQQALRAATSLPALRFGLPDRGRVAPGLRADLLLVDGDPTTDITATRAIAEVWRRGARLAT